MGERGLEQGARRDGGGSAKISGAGDAVAVRVEEFNPAEVTRSTVDGFVEANGYVSMEAAHFSKDTGGWVEVPDLGRTLSGMTVLPPKPTQAGMLEYRMYLFHTGQVKVNTIVAPTQAFVPGRGLRFAVSFDDEAPQVVDSLAHNSPRDWEESVRNNARTVQTIHTLAKPGYHVLKIGMVDPGVVLEKIVVDLGGLKPSYLGPPESYRRPAGRLGAKQPFPHGRGSEPSRAR